MQSCQRAALRTQPAAHITRRSRQSQSPQHHTRAMATTQPARVPAEEAATHLRQMPAPSAARRRGPRRRPRRRGDPSRTRGRAARRRDARSADQLLRLLGELREAAARADAAERRGGDGRSAALRGGARGRRAAREARGRRKCGCMRSSSSGVCASESNLIGFRGTFLDRWLLVRRHRAAATQKPWRRPAEERSATCARSRRPRLGWIDGQH